MFKKILFAPIFLKTAHWAFTYTLNLAKNYKSKLFILHVTPEPYHPEQSFDLPPSRQTGRIEDSPRRKNSTKN